MVSSARSVSLSPCRTVAVPPPDACRVKPALALKAKELKCGVAGDDGTPTVLQKQEMPEGLICGFEGAPDASGMYSKVKATSFGSDPTAIIGSDYKNKA